MSVDNERRSGGQRVPIKTLVEIGAGAGGSAAFEAESVDITTAGMHLKTAYLPELGEPLVCRFEGNGKEIVVQGEVVWRNEDAYGGDFGVRFLELDPESLEALRELLGEQPEAEAAQDDPVEERPRASRNTRVRLHIEGLGSPMKARVREVTRSEVLVGSNLEFLKVGRSVDLENLDCAENRPARIERVNIEIDPSSHVPQLMVALRYLDASADTADDHVEAAAAHRGRSEETDMVDEDDSSSEVDSEHDEEPDQDGPRGRTAVLWSKVKEVGPKLAGIGGKAKVLGVRAKDVVARAIDRARSKGAQASDDQPRVRRTTAPPPNGGLRGDGTRSPREAIEDALNEIPPGKKRIAKRAAVIGAAILMIAIIAVAFTRKPKTDATASAEAADSAAAQSEGAVPDEAAGSVVPAAPNGMVANVPLFGPTPMATGPTPTPTVAAAAVASGPTAFPAAVAVPPPEDAKPNADDTADEAGDDEGAGSAAVAANAAAGNDEEQADDASDTGDSDDAAAKPAARPARASHTASSKPSAGSFGRGKVRNPTVLALRMNQSIKSIRGNGSASGFTVEVAGARSKEAASGLARQDRRIASARVTNKGSSADLVVRFREPIPGYRVVAQGNTLRILLGNERKTANATKPESRNHKGSPASGKKKQGKKSSAKR